MLKELILESRYKNYNYDKEILNTANEFLDSFANMIIDKYLLKLKSHFPFIKSKYDLILAYIMYKTKTTQNKTGKSSIIFSKGFKISYSDKKFNLKLVFKLLGPNVKSVLSGGYLPTSSININSKRKNQWPIIEVIIPRIKSFSDIKDDKLNFDAMRYRVDAIRNTLVHEITHAIEHNIFKKIPDYNTVNYIAKYLCSNFINYYIQTQENKGKLPEEYNLYKKYRKGFKRPEYERAKKYRIVLGSEYTESNNVIYPSEFNFVNILARLIFEDVSPNSKSLKEARYLLEIAKIMSHVPHEFYILQYFMTVILPQTKYFNLVKYDEEYRLFYNYYKNNAVINVMKYISAAINFYVNNQDNTNFDKEKAMNILKRPGNIYESTEYARDFYYKIKDCLATENIKA